MAELPAATFLGPVRLTVADATGVTAFYERVVGLRTLGYGDDGSVRLGAAGGDRTLVELVPDASAPPRPRRSCGLFHLAILVPDRLELARALRRIAAGGWGLDGASDHLVSEALYLSDPEGNGIEIYRDRPRDEWRRTADGELAMATLPLDFESLAVELDREPRPAASAQSAGAPGGAEPAPHAELAARAASGAADDPGMPPGTRIGHVHLQVGDLRRAEAFYADALGFEVIVRSYPGALFVAAGGYHHHLGLNVWASRGGPPRDPSARGLRDFAVVLPDGAARDAAADRLTAAGYPVAPAGDREGDLLATDPFGIAVRLQAAA